MKSIFRVVFAALMVLLSGVSFGGESIAENQFFKGAAQMSVTSMTNSIPRHGYMAVKVDIRNGTKTDRQWVLKFDSTVQNYSFSVFGNDDVGSTMRSSFVLGCESGQQRSYEILVPVVTVLGTGYSGDSRLELNLTTETSGETTFEDYLSWSSPDNEPAVLVSSVLADKNPSQFINIKSLSPVTSHLGGSSGSSHEAAVFSAQDLMGDWMAYAGYDVIIMTDREWLVARSSVRNALLEWNRLGGHLIFYATDSAMKLSSLGIELDIVAGAEHDGRHGPRSFGRVDVFKMLNNNSIEEKKDLAKAVYIESPEKPFSSQIVEEFEWSKWGLYKALRGQDFSPALMVLVLAVFGILVGPVNLFVFAKAGRRHRLFVTTPLIALGASLVLIAVILVQDGFGGSGGRVQLVEIRADGGEYKAYVKQQQFCRTGVLMNTTVEMDERVCITPVPVTPSRLSRVTVDNAGGDANYRIQMVEDGMVAEGDWFQARSELAHYIEAVVPTRARITLAGNADQPILQSGFEFEIDVLLYLDASGQWWSSNGAVKSGAKVKVKKITKAVASRAIDKGCKRFTVELRDHSLKRLLNNRGRFIAVTQSAPAIETLSSVDWEQTDSIYTGPVVAE